MSICSLAKSQTDLYDQTASAKWALLQKVRRTANQRTKKKTKKNNFLLQDPLFEISSEDLKKQFATKV